jgi:hypothetical protein
MIQAEGFKIFKTIIHAKSILTISFSMSLESPIDAKSAIYINLPYYYNSEDNKESLTCKVNGDLAFCDYFAERTIKVKYFQ